MNLGTCYIFALLGVNIIHGVRISTQSTLQQNNLDACYTENFNTCLTFPSCDPQSYTTFNAHCLNGLGYDSNTNECHNSIYPSCTGNTSDNKTNIQVGPVVVPSFPRDVFDTCDADSLRMLPSRCFEQLNENSTEAEQLACAIVSQQGSKGLFPFGLYPLGTAFDENLENVPQSTLSMFSPCALPLLVENKCFSFTRHPDLSFFKFSNFAAAGEYMASALSTTTTTLKTKVRVLIVTVKTSYTQETATYSAHAAQYATAGLKRGLVQQIGTLTMDSCFQDFNFLQAHPEIFNKDYFDYWKAMSSMSLKQLLTSSEFSEVSTAGMFFPTTFNIGAEFHYNSKLTYASHQNSSGTGEKTERSVSLSVVFDDSVSLGLTGSWGNYMASLLNQSHGNAILNENQIEYGQCDFENINEFSQSSANLLSQCAAESSVDLSQLAQFTSIPSGGFMPITDVLENFGIPLSPYFEDAMDQYATLCSCARRGSSTKFTCLNPDQTFNKSASSIMMCDSEEWVLLNGFPQRMPQVANSNEIIDTNTFPEYFNVTSPSGLYQAYLTPLMYVTPGLWYSKPQELSSLQYDTTDGSLIVLILGVKSGVILPACGSRESPGTYQLIVTDEGVLSSFNSITQETCNMQLYLPSISAMVGRCSLNVLLSQSNMPKGFEATIDNAPVAEVSSEASFVRFIRDGVCD